MNRRRNELPSRGLPISQKSLEGKGTLSSEIPSPINHLSQRHIKAHHHHKTDDDAEAGRIAVAGGVQGMAVAAADAPVRAIQDHASLSHMTTTREGAIRKDGLNLWLNALYGAEHARNLGAGSLDGGYNADYAESD